jgi:hypothetical protein
MKDKDIEKFVQNSAFPFQFEFGDKTYVAAGLTARDYFAARAMQAFCSTLNDLQSDSQPKWNVLADDSYLMADAMLKAREK